MRRILLCQRFDDEVKTTVDGLALLVGVTTEELLEVWDPKSGAAALPPDLQRRGQKRAKTARDALGDSAGYVVLAYWADAEWGARVDLDEAGGQMWAIRDGVDGE
jgi:hypothetical protein